MPRNWGNDGTAVVAAATGDTAATGEASDASDVLLGTAASTCGLNGWTIGVDEQPGAVINPTKQAATTSD
jgi:hypothetical protein